MKTHTQKRDEAQIRDEEYNSLSLAQKIESVKAAPGKSRRQLTRLTKELNRQRKNKS